MTGSLQVKNGKYYIVLNTYENGKRKPKWIATGLEVKGNKRRAEQMLRDTLAQYEQQSVCPKCDVLLSDYIRTWLTVAKRSVDDVTYQGYEVLANSQLLPYFDNNGLLLQNVQYEDIQAYIDEKSLSGRKDGKGGLSPRSIRLHNNILHQTFQLAVKNKLIPSNPCDFVILPKTTRYEASFYTADELKSFLKAIEHEELANLIHITALYGLRRSEVLGLKWDSIDFQNGTVTIKHTVSKVTTAVEKDKTKNASSYRSFPLTEEARAIFLSEKEREKENSRLLKSDYVQNDYVFKWNDGHPYSPDFVTRGFSKLLKKYHFRHIRFHELRHSCASLLINAGCSLKDVQEWLGHSDIKMTANIYGHLDVARKQSMAGLLSDRLTERC